MTEDLNLDAEAEALENYHRSVCSVCSFIEAQPEGHQDEWDRVMRGPRKHATVFRLLKSRGFTVRTDGPVANHRNGGHRL